MMEFSELWISQWLGEKYLCRFVVDFMTLYCLSDGSGYNWENSGWVEYLTMVSALLRQLEPWMSSRVGSGHPVVTLRSSFLFSTVQLVNHAQREVARTTSMVEQWRDTSSLWLMIFFLRILTKLPDGLCNCRKVISVKIPVNVYFSILKNIKTYKMICTYLSILCQGNMRKSVWYPPATLETNHPPSRPRRNSCCC